MRIAQFTESYRPVINGVAVAVDLLADELSRRHEVRIFAPRFPGHPEETGVHRFPSYFVPPHREYPLALPFSAEASRQFRREPFQVIHTHSPFALGGVGRRWARHHGIPLVTTYHTLYVEYAHYAPSLLPARFVRAFLRRLSRDYCNACDVVAVPTDPIREVLLGYGVRRPIHVIPTGLRLVAPAAPDAHFPREAFGIPPDAPLVLYAGRLAREKNLELLFGAFARVSKVMPEAYLLVAGSGPAEQEARRQAAGAAGERVRFSGFLPPERMPQVYAAADLFAFASLTDTQGLVLTEAKAAGLPVVSVNAYGPSAVVTDGLDGLLVPNDADAFAAALLRLLRDPDLRARMREAALRESRRFSIEATATAYERVYEEAAAAVRPRY